MKIIEVRDGFIKLETEKYFKVSSFLEVKGLEKRYIAQVVKINDNGAGNTVYAKILFVYDGSLMKYDKTLPDVNAEITPFDFSFINNSFRISSPVVAGKFVENSADIILDSSTFNSSALVSVDSNEIKNVLISNLSGQFKQRGTTIVIDMSGTVNGNKYVAGRDFKLPLNREALEFMYEDCLRDATSESKNTIKEIFADLCAYSDEVPFLPFTALKNIVDDMVEKSHIFKLLVLKNKLEKFEKAGYFALTKNEADNLSEILKSDLAILDLSKVDPLFQNRYLSVIYSTLKKENSTARVLVDATNAINKKNIKTIVYPECEVYSVFITHSKFKYIKELQSLFKNFFVENTYTNKENFKLYSFFLNAMNSESYLIVGEGTNYIPLISKVEKYDADIKPQIPDTTASEVVNSEYDSDISAGVENTEPEEEELPEPASEQLTPEDTTNTVILETEEVDDTELEVAEPVEEFHTKVDPTTLAEVPDEIYELSENTTEELQDYNTPAQLTEEDKDEYEPEETAEEEDISIPSELEPEYNEVKDLDSEPEYIEQDETLNNMENEFSEPQIMPLNNNDSDFDEIIELDPSEISDDDILVDLTDEENVPEERTALTPEELDREITEDVDKVFTTIKDDSISDSDLDFIDALNDSADELHEEQSVFDSNDMETLEELAGPDEEEADFLEPLQEVSDLNSTEEEHEVLPKRDTSTPIVPVYDAEIPEEDKIMSDHVEQGDNVIHAKYGSGVVEKVIKYGNKTLHSINFDNVGRRLLDLEITEVKKA